VTSLSEHDSTIVPNPRIKTATKASDRDGQLLFAAKIGAARELFEETGIDIRAHLDRLVPARLGSFDPNNQRLVNELGRRLFFILTMTNSDFTKDGVRAMRTDDDDDDVVDGEFAHARVSFERLLLLVAYGRAVSFWLLPTKHRYSCRWNIRDIHFKPMSRPR
jgi:8-oxo-dGTP pyrophosphatase MutT (NUDIX family)